MPQHIPNFFFNKHLWCIVIFIVWLSFVDDDSFLVQYKLYKQYHELEIRKKKIQQNLEEIKTEIYAYQQRPQLLEKYARENYLMKKDNETLFILIDK